MTSRQICNGGDRDRWDTFRRSRREFVVDFAWLGSSTCARHRQRDSRSAIAMSGQYLTGNARYQGRARHLSTLVRIDSDQSLTFCLSMIFSENRYPPRIRSGAGFFGIMLQLKHREAPLLEER